MPLRIQSSSILYPFVPAAEAGRARIAGIVDAFFLVRGSGEGWLGASSSSVSSILSLSSSSSGGFPITRSHFMAFYSLAVGPAANTYVFYGSVPDGRWFRRTFQVPRGQGLVRVAADEDLFSFLVLDTNRVPDLPALAGDHLWLELEPARIVWQLEEVRSIRLTNEYREHDTRVRNQALAANPDTTVLHLDNDGDVLDLVDGHNCHLEYDEATGTLAINGGPGLGTGLPLDFPWDSAAFDIFSGIRSINGVNAEGDVPLKFGLSLFPVYEPNEITINVRAE